MTTPITKKFGGKVYHEAAMRVTKDTAQRLAKRIRKQGFLARVVKEERGKYSVYSYPHGLMP